MKSLLTALLASLVTRIAGQEESVDILEGRGFFTTLEEFEANWKLVDPEQSQYTFNLDQEIAL